MLPTNYTNLLIFKITLFARQIIIITLTNLARNHSNKHHLCNNLFVNYTRHIAKTTQQIELASIIVYVIAKQSIYVCIYSIDIYVCIYLSNNANTNNNSNAKQKYLNTLKPPTHPLVRMQNELSF